MSNWVETTRVRLFQVPIATSKRYPDSITVVMQEDDVNHNTLKKAMRKAWGDKVYEEKKSRIKSVDGNVENFLEDLLEGDKNVKISLTFPENNRPVIYNEDGEIEENGEFVYGDVGSMTLVIGCPTSVNPKPNTAYYIKLDSFMRISRWDDEKKNKKYKAYQDKQKKAEREKDLEAFKQFEGKTKF